MFLHLSVILFTWGGSVHAGIHPPKQTPPWEQTPPVVDSACWEIQATSGQYASCWNAYLLLPATKFGQGYIFTGVCDSVHRGVGIPACTEADHPPTPHPPGADTPPDQTSPRPDTPRADTPPGADTPQSRHPPEQNPPP